MVKAKRGSALLKKVQQIAALLRPFQHCVQGGLWTSSHSVDTRHRARLVAELWNHMSPHKMLQSPHEISDIGVSLFLGFRDRRLRSGRGGGAEIRQGRAPGGSGAVLRQEHGTLWYVSPFLGPAKSLLTQSFLFLYRSWVFLWIQSKLDPFFTGQRAGCLSVIGESAKEASAVESQLKVCN